MLSAVAARKQRLQQQGKSGTASPSSGPSSPPTVESPQGAEATKKPASKRKASNNEPRPTPRKKKSKQPGGSSPVKDSRYFHSLSKDEATPDLIVVDDDESEGDDPFDVSDDDS